MPDFLTYVFYNSQRIHTSLTAKVLMEMLVYLDIYGYDHNGTTSEVMAIPANVGDNLARTLWLGGLFTEQSLCANRGKCGNCRVRYLEKAPPVTEQEKTVFDETELTHGWRLSCRHLVTPDAGLIIDVPDERKDNNPISPVICTPDIACKNAVLAIDLGTTSICWKSLAQGCSQQGDRVVGSGSLANPQTGCGADIVSRLEMAVDLHGAFHLSAKAREAVRKIVAAHYEVGWTIERICVAANTAMTDIFLGKDISGLTRSPFRLAHYGNSFFDLAGLPPIYIPPLPAPFIGGDASAGVLALMEAGVRRPFVLVDMGTNGEFILLDKKNRLFMASVPLGPAMEGSGMECGRGAGPGVLGSFFLSSTGIMGQVTKKNVRDASVTDISGISATGYISLLSLLHRIGLMDDDGHFMTRCMPIAKKLERDIVRYGKGARLILPERLWLGSGDIEEMLKIKGAFALALKSLIHASGLAVSDIEALCLGGALGQHAAPADLVELGFIPAMLEKKVSSHGNTSLAGAAILALDPIKGNNLGRLFQNAELVCLNEKNDFLETYLDNMKFHRW